VVVPARTVYRAFEVLPGAQLAQGIGAAFLVIICVFIATHI
jgi:hypothetical protein